MGSEFDLPWDMKIRVGATSPSGARPFSATGINRQIQTADLPTDLWTRDSPPTLPAVYPYLAAAADLEVLSSSASDDASPPGIGAQQVLLVGLDSSYREIVAIVALDGVTPVAVTGVLFGFVGPNGLVVLGPAPTNQFLRINDFICIAGGSSALNTGNVGRIDCRVAGGGTVLSRIQANDGQAFQWVRTVPAGYNFHFTDGYFALYRASAGVGSDSGELQLKVRPFGSSCFINVNFVALQVGGNPPFILPRMVASPVPQKADFKITVSFVSANLSIVGVSVGGVLIPI